MNHPLEQLIGGLRAARDAGIVTGEEAARTLGEISSTAPVAQTPSSPGA
jgi:hypothetical protein